MKIVNQNQIFLQREKEQKYKYMDNQERVMRSQLLSSLSIYNIQLGNYLQNILQNLELKNRSHFIGKTNITYKILGKNTQKKCYFILEINDLKKVDDLLKTNESLINNQYTTSIQTTNKLFYDTDLNQSNLEIFKVDKEEVTSNISKTTQPFFQRFINKYELKQQQQNIYILGIESARDSVSNGPLSYRINFISPSLQQQQLQELKDFIELQNQLEYINQDLNQEIYIPDSSQIKSNSKEQNQKSLNIIEIYQNNKLNQNIDDIDRDAKKSKSSITSGTSGLSARSTIKQFQSNTQMIDDILWHIQQNDKFIQNKLNKHQLILMDHLFNRYFFQLFTYTWSLVFNILDIIESSKMNNF